MKIRSGFVSNSSSSSFICVVCGEEASGWDIGLADAGMFECKNGHTCCTTHSLSKKELATKQKRDYLIADAKNSGNYETDVELKERLDEISEYDDDAVEEDYSDELSGGEPVDNCPICQFESLSKDDALNYLYKKYTLTSKSVLTEIKTNYSDYNAFKKVITSTK